MINKAKTKVAILVAASFLAGGMVFGAHQAGAFAGGRTPFGEGCDFCGIERGSAEWEAKMEEIAAKREELIAERGENKGFRRESRVGGRGLRFGIDTNYDVENIQDGVKITVISDDPEVVKRLQDWAARFSK